MIDRLSINGFNELVASYGADPDRWPAERRSGAVECLVRSDTARTAWRAAAELDADLDSLPGMEASPELVETVLAIPDSPQKQHGGILSGPLHHFMPYAAAAAIALMVGLSVPSPFRDAAGTPAQNQAALTAPAVDTETVQTDTALTTLAIVDSGAFTENGIDTSEASSNASLLAELPLM